MSKHAASMVVALAAVALTTWTPAQAVLLDFESPYVNGNIGGQDDPNGGLWSAAAGANVTIENRPTNGIVHVISQAATTSTTLTLDTAIVPGGDGHIYASVSIGGFRHGDAVDDGNTFRVIFRNATGELARVQGTESGATPRGPGGTGGTGTNLNADANGPFPDGFRTFFIDIDTTYAVSGVGGRPINHRDNLAGAVLDSGIYIYPATTPDQITQITIESINAGVGRTGHLDNIKAVASPEPGTVALLALGGLLMRRRRTT